MMQNGEGLRAVGPAVQGGVITVEAGPNGGTVDVSVVGGSTTSHPVGAGKTAQIPVPLVPPGTTILIAMGKFPHRYVIEVEVIAPTP